MREIKAAISRGVNNGSQRKRDMHVCPIIFGAGTKKHWSAKADGRKKKNICKVFLSAHPRRPPEISEQLLRRCQVTKRKAEESSWQQSAVCKRGLSHRTQLGISGQCIIFPPGPIPGTLYFPPCVKYYLLRLCI